MIKYSGATCHVNVQLRINVSDILSASIITVDMCE
jgi:hypothetical protein